MSVLDKYFDQLGGQFKFLWDVYIKFYTAFLLFNISGLGIAVKFAETLDNKQRWVIVGVFLIQNIFCSIISFMVGSYSCQTAKRMRDLGLEMAKKENTFDHNFLIHIEKTPIPGELGKWVGYANGVAQIALAIFWALILFLPKETLVLW